MVNLFPKVVKVKALTTLKFYFDSVLPESANVGVRIQGMESYTVEHTPRYRIDEEERYPVLDLVKHTDHYSLDYSFSGEQKYSITLLVDGKKYGRRLYVFALENDLYSKRPYKGDTHLHTCRSDGKGTPFEVGCRYRSAGYDFIAITDHHKMAPSIEGGREFSALTDQFAVIQAEEVHNKGMGYFHIINLGGKISVNEIIEAGDGFAEGEVERILSTQVIPEGATPYICAYRTFVSEMIRKGGGLAVMAHPYWECFGEYNMPHTDVVHLLKQGTYDAIELVAGCDMNGNGNNLQLAVWQELLCDGVRIPPLGCSDCHDTESDQDLFNKQFSLVFSDGLDGVLSAISRGFCVAVEWGGGYDFRAYGSYRLVNYSRFLLDYFYPRYCELSAEHAAALGKRDCEMIKLAEEKMNGYIRDFFG